MVSLHPPKGLLDPHLKSTELNLVIMITGVHESQLDTTGSSSVQIIADSRQSLGGCPSSNLLSWWTKGSKISYHRPSPEVYCRNLSAGACEQTHTLPVLAKICFEWGCAATWGAKSICAPTLLFLHCSSVLEGVYEFFLYTNILNLSAKGNLTQFINM